MKGIVCGSFDPITKGHLWVFDAAATILNGGMLHIVVAVNAAKPGRFDSYDRIKMIQASMEGKEYPYSIQSINQKLLIDHATDIGASMIIKGVRNASDLQYESDIAEFNRQMNPNVLTTFVFPPREMSYVSSSFVMGLAKTGVSKSLLEQYVHPTVADFIVQ